MSHAFGEVVLVTFPFTDQSVAKKRPAVIVSGRTYNASRRDLVIMAITTQVRQPAGFGETLLADWQTAGLVKSSVVKPVFATIEQSLVLRILGTLSAGDKRALRQAMTQSIG